MNIAQFYIERHYARGSSAELPPTPLQRLRRWAGARRPNVVATPLDRNGVATTTGAVATTSGDANAPLITR